MSKSVRAFIEIRPDIFVTRDRALDHLRADFLAFYGRVEERYADLGNDAIAKELSAALKQRK